MIWFWIILYLINACLYSVFTVIRFNQDTTKDRIEVMICSYFVIALASLVLMPGFLIFDILCEIRK